MSRVPCPECGGGGKVQHTHFGEYEASATCTCHNDDCDVAQYTADYGNPMIDVDVYEGEM